MDFELPEDMAALRDLARRFAAEQIGPDAREWDRNGEIPPDVIQQLGELGFLRVMSSNLTAAIWCGHMVVDISK